MCCYPIKASGQGTPRLCTVGASWIHPCHITNTSACACELSVDSLGRCTHRQAGARGGINTSVYFKIIMVLQYFLLTKGCSCSRHRTHSPYMCTHCCAGIGLGLRRRQGSHPQRQPGFQCRQHPDSCGQVCSTPNIKRSPVVVHRTTP